MANYLDRNPSARARLLRAFILETLKTQKTISASKLAWAFNVKHDCSISDNGAARLCRVMAQEGILSVVRAGNYCHAARPAVGDATTNTVFELIGGVSRPRPMYNLTLVTGMPPYQLYGILRQLKRHGLVAKPKGAGGYSLTPAGIAKYGELHQPRPAPKAKVDAAYNVFA